MPSAVELRCSANPSRLLAKIKDPDIGAQIIEGNLIEIACDWCKQSQRMKGARCARVLHRFNVAGELVETEVVR